MTDHSLGRTLRAAIEQERRSRRSWPDPCRLETVLLPLLPSDQQDLRPALIFLLRSRALDSALGQAGGGGDQRLVGRLMQEVQGQFSPSLCQRLQPLIEGLLGIPPTAPPTMSAPPSAPFAVVNAGGGGIHSLLALLGFLIGSLVGGLLLLLWLQRERMESPDLATAPLISPASPSRTAHPPASFVPAAAPEADGVTGAARGDLDRAVVSVQQLYAELSAKNFAAASSLYGPVAADQFDADFFNQFERVSVADLHQTSRAGSSVNLEGVVTFVYANGAIQTETRSFSVDTSSTPARITASEFGRVLKSR